MYVLLPFALRHRHLVAVRILKFYCLMGNQQAHRMASAALGGAGNTRHGDEHLHAPPETKSPLAPLSYGCVKLSEDSSSLLVDVFNPFTIYPQATDFHGAERTACYSVSGSSRTRAGFVRLA